MSARVFAIYEGQVISYTLERWQINVKGNGTVTDDEETIFKTVHPTDADHETYVGIFVGHLDGGASYLGLWGGNTDSTSANGKIVVNGRAARSFNVLVGRSRTDNPLDSTAANYYNRFINFHEVLYNNPAMRTTLWSIPQTPLRSSYLVQQSNAISATQSYGLTSDETDYFRVYPRIQNTATTFDVVQDDGTITTGKPYSSYAIRFQHVTSGSTIVTDGRLGASVRATLQNSTYYRRNFNVLNGFWLWSTDKINSRAEDVFGLNEFEVSLNMSYVATSSTLNNKFQILWNTYNPDAVYKFLWWTWEANKVNSASWGDLSAQTTVVDGVTVPIYSPNEHPLISQLTPTRTSSGVIQETSINFVVNREDNGFWQNLFDYILLNEPYYPMFAFGVGKNGTYVTDNYVQQSISGTTYRFYDGRYAVDDYTLDILSIELLFTAREGNISNLLNNVDFLYSLPTYTNNPDGSTTFTAWNKASKVKVQFNVVDPALNLNGTTYRFWRVAGFSGVNSYVNGIYTTGTNYAPFNTVGYDNATLTPGTA